MSAAPTACACLIAYGTDATRDPSAAPPYPAPAPPPPPPLRWSRTHLPINLQKNHPTAAAPINCAEIQESLDTIRDDSTTTNKATFNIKLVAKATAEYDCTGIQLYASTLKGPDSLSGVLTVVLTGPSANSPSRMFTHPVSGTYQNTYVSPFIRVDSPRILLKVNNLIMDGQVGAALRPRTQARTHAFEFVLMHRGGPHTRAAAAAVCGWCRSIRRIQPSPTHPTLVIHLYVAAGLPPRDRRAAGGGREPQVHRPDRHARSKIR